MPKQSLCIHKVITWIFMKKKTLFQHFILTLGLVYVMLALGLTKYWIVNEQESPCWKMSSVIKCSEVGALFAKMKF